jgi:hypothetical protein
MDSHNPTAVLESVVATSALASTVPADLLNPAILFDALTFDHLPGFRHYYDQIFEVVAAPGEALSASLRPGDLLLRRGLGEGALADLAIVADTEAIEPYRLPEGLTPQSTLDGLFAGTIGSPRAPTTWDTPVAHRVTNAGGHLGRDQIILRLREASTALPDTWPLGGEGQLETEVPKAAVPPPGGRTSSEYIRWVQSSLNQVMGLGLAVDGILGPRTRAAIKMFQKRSGLTPDGVLGAGTEAALRAALKTPDSAAPSAADWIRLLPRARSKNKAQRRSEGVTRVINEPGKPPRLEYTSSLEIAPTSASPTTVQAALGTIVTARQALAPRPIVRPPWPPHAGNFYDPVEAEKQGDAEAAPYNAWTRTALPTGLRTSDPIDGQDWQIFQRLIPLEGRVGTVTTSDEYLTVGIGFSSAGRQAEAIIRMALQKDADANAAAKDAGLAIEGQDLVVVDTERGLVLHGVAAANYLQTDVTLLSFLVNLSQGSRLRQDGEALPTSTTLNRRQTWLDAQWHTFRAHTLAGMPTAIRTWPLDSTVLAVHARHAVPGHFPWGFWTAHANAELQSMVLAIWERLIGNYSPERARNIFMSICNGPLYRPIAQELLASKQEEIGGYQARINDLATEIRRLQSIAPGATAEHKHAIEQQIAALHNEIARLQHRISSLAPYS